MWIVVAPNGRLFNVLSGKLSQRDAVRRARTIPRAFAVPANRIDPVFLRVR